MLRWHYFLSRKRTNDDLGGGLLQIYVSIKINWMTLYYEKEQTFQAIESNFPSFIVKLCNYCSTFSVSPEQLWKLEETWWFGILLAETKGKHGLQKRQTAHERTNHTTEREIKTKHSLLKPDSPISLHALAQIVSTYCLLGCLTDCFIGYNPDWGWHDLKLHV